MSYNENVETNIVFVTLIFLITQEEEVSDEADAGDQSDDDDGVFNDPDFAHMSDSDLDSKLPLFEGSDSVP